MRRKIKTWVGMLLACLLLTAGCGSSNAGQAGKPSNRLTVYTAFPEQEVIPYIEAFRKETGIDVKFVRLSAGETLVRLQAEKNAPQASVWYGGPSDTFHAAAQEGLLEKYQPKEAAQLPKRFTDPQGYWSPVYVGALGFAVNEEWLKKKGLSAPESWDDLLKPEYADNVVMAHPGASGTAYTVLATLVQMMGEEKAFAYLKKLDAHMRQYTKSGSAPAKQAGLGETGVGISFAHDILAPKSEGYPLLLTFPKEGTGYEIGAVALIKNGPADELENAKKFIDWTAGLESQNLYAKTKTFRLPVRPDAEVPEGAVTFDKIKLADYDAVWAGEHRKELVKKFETEVRGQSGVK
ncbi:ABC transporter substrate-binding protein [Brevibacillus brevis]|uniref:ABC transporter substrate-binding protein n=1 Tax=Brevibacillus brevis TaxID=1393 RepID=A0ABY9TCS5_BREBE|nr:ABC transporter substrate-binding protein [Brevibacillus brevis]WNC17001.1 ABC transporter substrate-binding protein [Brevibacillus brevis]